VQDNMPFLVDSTRMAINYFDLQIHFICHFSGLKITTDDHHVTEIIIDNHNNNNKNVMTVAPIYIEVDAMHDQEEMDKLKQKIISALEDVKLTVTDWRKMV